MPTYFTLPKTTSHHFCPHPIPIGKHVKQIPRNLCKTCGIYRAQVTEKSSPTLVYFRLIFVFLRANSAGSPLGNSLHPDSLPLIRVLSLCGHYDREFETN